MCKNHADLKEKPKDDGFQFAIFTFIIFYNEQTDLSPLLYCA